MAIDGRNTTGKPSARGGCPGRMPRCGPHPFQLRLALALYDMACTTLKAQFPIMPEEQRHSGTMATHYHLSL